MLSLILLALIHLSQNNRAGRTGSATTAGASSFLTLFGNLFRNPLRLLLLWNWKSALMSIMLREPIFLAATIRRGINATLSAFLTECVFCMITAGFYAAIVQYLRDAEPEWLTIAFLTIVMPGLFQGLEFLLHRAGGTPHLRIAEIVSILISGVSSLFNLYAMRRGTLLVGGEGSSFGSDLRQLPRMFFEFVASGPCWLINRAARPANLPKEPAPAEAGKP